MLIEATTQEALYYYVLCAWFILCGWIGLKFGIRLGRLHLKRAERK